MQIKSFFFSLSHCQTIVGKKVEIALFMAPLKFSNFRIMTIRLNAYVSPVSEENNPKLSTSSTIHGDTW